MTLLWQDDVFKGKWSILAKSYSVIRDVQGKSKSPLDKFLALNAPLLKIISPADYLQTMGWEIASDYGQLIFHREEKEIDQSHLRTNTSVNDVIVNAYENGYFTGNLSDVLIPDNKATLVMATSIQHSKYHKAINSGKKKISGTSNITNPIAGGFRPEMMKDVMADVVYDGPTGFTEAGNAVGTGLESKEYEETTATIDGHIPIDEEKSALVACHTHPDDALATPPTTGTNNTHPGNVSSGLNAQDTNPRNRDSNTQPNSEYLLPSDFFLDGDYAFDMAFDPDIAGLTFDPFLGNRFDAFDISSGWTDFVDFDGGA